MGEGSMGGIGRGALAGFLAGIFGGIYYNYKRYVNG